MNTFLVKEEDVNYYLVEAECEAEANEKIKNMSPEDHLKSVFARKYANTATEMRRIADAANSDMANEKKLEVINFFDARLMPEIENAAKAGKYSVRVYFAPVLIPLISIYPLTQGMDAKGFRSVTGTLTKMLEERGYEVKTTPEIIKISWR